MLFKCFSAGTEKTTQLIGRWIERNTRRKLAIGCKLLEIRAKVPAGLA